MFEPRCKEFTNGDVAPHALLNSGSGCVYCFEFTRLMIDSQAVKQRRR